MTDLIIEKSASTFHDLRTGATFRWKRHLYWKVSANRALRLTGRNRHTLFAFAVHTRVTRLCFSG